MVWRPTHIDGGRSATTSQCLPWHPAKGYKQHHRDSPDKVWEQLTLMHGT